MTDKQAEVSATANVLDIMTRSIVEKKAAKDAKLTPVGVEAGAPTAQRVGLPDVPEVFLTNEAVQDVAKDLRRQAELLISVSEGLEKHVGRVESKPTVDAALAAQKAAEREADAAAAARPAAPFVVDFAAKQAAAQAAAFTSSSTVTEADTPVAPVAGDDGWDCPIHKVHIVKTSRAGRKYRACTVAGCGEFEKL